MVDLFAGAGGLSEGFHRMGFNAIAYVEKDKTACETLLTRHIYWDLKRNKNINIYKDYVTGKIVRSEFLKYLEGENPIINKEISLSTLPEIKKSILHNMKQLKISKVDLFVGGPPCQAYSLVGRARDKYGMKNDPRNRLYEFYIDLLKKFKPTMFVFENVPGILTAGKGKLWIDIQNAFKEAGYEIDYKILDASNFNVLQKRKRVILLGWRKRLKIKYPDFEIKEPQFKVSDILDDLPKLKAGEQVISGEYREPPSEYLKLTKIRNPDDILIDHISRPLNDHDSKIYQLVINKWNKEGKRLEYSEVPSKLKTHKNENSFTDRFKIVAGNLAYSQTMVAHISQDGHYYIHPDINQLRSISVRESARIQSFPDDYKFEGARTSMYRQIGNAVPPLLAEEIAKEIKKILCQQL